MVSDVGARKVADILARKDNLSAGVARLQGALSANPLIWKMAADAYVGQRSTSLEMLYNLNARQSAAVLQAVLTALQEQLADVTAELDAVT